MKSGLILGVQDCDVTNDVTIDVKPALRKTKNDKTATKSWKQPQNEETKVDWIVIITSSLNFNF